MAPEFAGGRACTSGSGAGGLECDAVVPQFAATGARGWAWRCELGSGRYPVEVGLAGLSLMR